LPTGGKRNEKETVVIDDFNRKFEKERGGYSLEGG